MARETKTVVTFIDDLDGTVLEDGQGETVKFSLDGTNYEIDLSKDNAKAFRDSFKQYVKAGRTATTRRASSSGTKTDKRELAAARTWLRENGHEVSDRGRVPNDLMELYRTSK